MAACNIPFNKDSRRTEQTLGTEGLNDGNFGWFGFFPSEGKAWLASNEACEDENLANVFCPARSPGFVQDMWMFDSVFAVHLLSRAHTVIPILPHRVPSPTTSWRYDRPACRSTIPFPASCMWFLSGCTKGCSRMSHQRCSLIAIQNITKETPKLNITPFSNSCLSHS